MACGADDSIVAMLPRILVAMEEWEIRLYCLAVATDGRPLYWFNRPADFSVGEVLPNGILQVFPGVFRCRRHIHPPFLMLSSLVALIGEILLPFVLLQSQ
jgi:hypothetical protein